MAKPPRAPYSGLVDASPEPIEAPAGLRIVLDDGAEDDELKERIVEVTAAALTDMWWPGEPRAVREARARVLATEFAMSMDLLFAALRMGPIPLSWNVLRAISPWPCPAGLPVRPLTANALVRRERELLAEIDYRRAGGHYPAGASDAQILAEIRRRSAGVGREMPTDPLEELQEVRRALGGSRRKTVGPGRGHLPPGLALDAVRLARAIDKAIPDGRRQGGNKPGIYRGDVLRAVLEIVFALTGTRVPRVRLVQVIQQHGSR